MQVSFQNVEGLDSLGFYSLWFKVSAYFWKMATLLTATVAATKVSPRPPAVQVQNTRQNNITAL